MVSLLKFYLQQERKQHSPNMSFILNLTNVSSLCELAFDVIRYSKFFSLLSLQILSVICSIFSLYHLLFNRILRKLLQHHVIIMLFASSFITCVTDLCLILYYLYNNQSPAKSKITCLLWNYLDLSLYALISLLMTWASIERHIFVFHERLFALRAQRLKYHYGPLVIIPIYVLIFYFIVIFLHPCENHFDYNQIVCGELCYYSTTPWIGLLDQLFHNIIPAVLIAVLNAWLFIRVIWQKQYRMRRPVSWRQHRRMTLQLIPASIIYVCGVLPYGSVVCAYLLGFSSETSLMIQGHFFYLFYYIAVLLPFVCLIGMPNIYSKLSCKRLVQVLPA